MIDLHAHVLPGVDDGPATVREAVALVAAAVAGGVDTIVATPHVDLHHGVVARHIGPAVDALNAALHASGVPAVVRAGGEIALSRLIDLTPAELALLGLAGGRCLLVEPPLRDQPGAFEWPIEQLLQEPGRRVLLAHPERCPAFRREPERLRRLVDAGALCQVTTGALLGDFGTEVRRFAERLLHDGLVHDVASDMHDLDRRPPTLPQTVQLLTATGLVSEATARWLTADVPRALLDGGELPPRP